MKNPVPVKAFCLLFLFVSGCSVFGVRDAEEPDYKILLSEGSFEVRSYEPYMVAETEIEQSVEDARSVGFRRLFAYISGNNSSGEEIAKTGPVLEGDGGGEGGQKIAMTAPVFISEDSRTMAFVLPREFDRSNAPEPSDQLVKLSERRGGKVAVRRFSGTISEERIKANSRELLQWTVAQGLKSSFSTVAAGYDPPWTIPFLRRNEIHLVLDQ